MFSFPRVMLAGLLLVSSTLPAFARYERFEPKRPTVKAKPFKGVPSVRATAGVVGRPAVFGTGAPVIVPKEGSWMNEIGHLYVAEQYDRAELARSRDPWDWLHAGEVLLAGERQPAWAEYQFTRVIQSPAATSRAKNLARQGKALALFSQGRLKEAVPYIKDILKNHNEGLAYTSVAAVSRHMEAKYRYHLGNEIAGIYQPWRLDPLTGVRSLGKALTRVGVAYDEAELKEKIRFDGFGSSLGDLEKGAKLFGANFYALSAQPEIIKAIPLPAVVRVEKDHYVAVIHADAKRVGYWCVDCGGEQTVNWKQWRMMEPDIYGVVTKPGSLEDEQILGALDGEDMAYAGEGVPSPYAGLAFRRIVEPEEGAGFLRQTIQCPCDQECPEARSLVTADPVNVATNGEEYKPGPDISVYNAAGPSVAFAREYVSHGNPVENGFGTGWSHNYNLVVNTYGVYQNEYQGPGPGSPPFADIVLPNSSHMRYYITNSGPPPSAQNPQDVQMTPFVRGLPYKLTWKWDSAAQRDYFEILTGDRTVIKTTFDETYPAPNQPKTSNLQNGKIHRIDTVTNSLGQALKFEYEDVNRSIKVTNNAEPNNFEVKTYSLRNLKRIKYGNTTLLTLDIGTNANYSRVTDNVGNRAVNYTVASFEEPNSQNGWPRQWYELTQASIIGTPGSSPMAANVYGYEMIVTSPSTNSKVSLLKTISVPSPTGSGLSTATLTYDAQGFVTGFTDANGYKCDIIQDENLNEAVIERRDAQNNLVAKYSLIWDSNMNLSGVRDANGVRRYTKMFGADTPYKPTSVTDAHNHTWTYTYDTNYGNLVTETTPRGITTTNTYNYLAFELGELRETATTGLTSTKYEYYPNGLLHKVKTPIPGEQNTGNRQTTEYTYFTNGNLWKVESPGNNAETTHLTTFYYGTVARIGRPEQVYNSNGEYQYFDYDVRGNVTSVKDHYGHETNIEYNLADQPVVTRLPNTGQTPSGRAESVNTYQYVGGFLGSTQAYSEAGTLMRTVNHAYGAEGEALSVSGDTEPWTKAYDAAYRVKHVDDGLGSSHRTSYFYNLSGQLTQVDLPMASGAHFDRVKFTSYNNNGQLLTKEDGRGMVTTYAYSEPDGQLTSYAYSSGGSVGLSYDSYGEVTTVTDSTGSSTSSVDDLGNVLQATRTYTGVGSFTFDYTYYPDGARNSMVNLAGTWSYLYDKAGRYKTMTSPMGSVTSDYNLNGWQMKRTLPNGAYTDYTYNNIGLLTSLDNRKQDNTQLSFWGGVTYDGVFNLSSITSSNNAGGSNFNGVQNFTHDAKDRLTQEQSTRFGSYTENNVWDGASNPLTFRNSANRTYNNANQRTNGALFVYDGNGNPTTYSGSAHTFDAENRLTSAPNFSAEYRADGLRAYREQTSLGVTTRRYMLYDGGTPCFEVDSAGALKATNIYAPDGLVSRSWDSSNRYFLFDWQGNLSQSMNSSTGLQASYAFNAWGQRNAVYPKQVEDVVNDNFGYNARWGYQRDGSTGYYYCQNRYYDPSNGRWLNRDPIGFAGGMNLYGYCGGGPIGAADPRGLQSVVNGLYVNPEDADEFAEGIREGTEYLKISGAALLSAFSDTVTGLFNGIPAVRLHGLLTGSDPPLDSWDGGSFRERPGFAESKVCWNVAWISGSFAGGLGAFKSSGGSATANAGKFQAEVRYPYPNTGGGGVKLSKYSVKEGRHVQIGRVEVHREPGRPWWQAPHLHKRWPTGKGKIGDRWPWDFK